MASMLENVDPSGMLQRGANAVQNFGNTDWSQIVPWLLSLIQQQPSQAPNALSGVQSGAVAAPAGLKGRITQSKNANTADDGWY